MRFKRMPAIYIIIRYIDSIAAANRQSRDLVARAVIAPGRRGLSCPTIACAVFERAAGIEASGRPSRERLTPN
jgi:hypothetical protein